ncbi:alpha/beta fold hydrolase [Acidicapsa dinghuensis]|uniref:Alpha/beta fold hydrolase n=1 Tax=Acidicapsa dinghuensis TaxID=2218256 RepID=A0ABW1E8N9_9BACT|nr:alpha/beta hydrolase [Acidicapsa dinghuensis]
MERRAFSNGKLRLSYLDSGGAGQILIALHGHWMEAATFIPLADCLWPSWRLVALDQRGHGYSDHAASYGRSDYLADIAALFRHLGVDSAVLLGHSLGGVNAYQFAAGNPLRVRAMIIEDIGATVSGDVSFIRPWSGTFPTQQALEERIGSRLAPYVRNSFRQTAAGWQLSFNPADEEISQKHLNGDHSSDWLASNCKALLIRGEHSPITKETEMRNMAERRANTTLLTLPGGHVVHADSPEEFCRAVTAFLSGIDRL